MKKTTALFCLILCAMLFALPALALDGEAAARDLYSRGLFKGTDVDSQGWPQFSLEQKLNRQQAVVMLVRLLGAEEEALTGSYSHPFTDVSAWADPYVGYAYSQGLTKGVSATAFGASRTTSGAQYLTFLLRSLGYSSDTDFAWDRSPAFAASLGLENAASYGNGEILRSDAALLSLAALEQKEKDGSRTLLAKLEAEGAIVAPVYPGPAYREPRWQGSQVALYQADEEITYTRDILWAFPQAATMVQVGSYDVYQDTPGVGGAAQVAYMQSVYYLLYTDFNSVTRLAGQETYPVGDDKDYVFLLDGDDDLLAISCHEKSGGNSVTFETALPFDPEAAAAQVRHKIDRTIATWRGKEITISRVEEDGDSRRLYLNPSPGLDFSRLYTARYSAFAGDVQTWLEQELLNSLCRGMMDINFIQPGRYQDPQGEEMITIYFQDSRLVEYDGEYFARVGRNKLSYVIFYDSQGELAGYLTYSVGSGE